MARVLLCGDARCCHSISPSLLPRFPPTPRVVLSSLSPTPCGVLRALSPTPCGVLNKDALGLAAGAWPAPSPKLGAYDLNAKTE
eukprot:3857653-Rhodomonas_salina.1